jgi:hypothetical protein
MVKNDIVQPSWGSCIRGFVSTQRSSQITVTSLLPCLYWAQLKAMRGSPGWRRTGQMGVEAARSRRRRTSEEKGRSDEVVGSTSSAVHSRGGPTDGTWRIREGGGAVGPCAAWRGSCWITASTRLSNVETSRLLWKHTSRRSSLSRVQSTVRHDWTRGLVHGHDDDSP